MNGWTWHEWGNRPFRYPQRGHGSFSENPDKQDTDFKLDEKSGLFLPETVTKERRKVQIGFHKEDE